MSEKHSASAANSDGCPSLLCSSRLVRLVKGVVRTCVPESMREWVNWGIGRNPWRPPPRLLVGDHLAADSFRLMAQMFLSRTPNYDVVVLPIIDWEFRFQRPQQLAQQFARNGHRVFYARTGFGPQAAWQGQAYIRPHEKNLAEFTLPGSPSLNLYRDRPDEAAVELWLNALQQLAVDYGLADTICLVQLPFWRPLALRLRERLGWKIVYDCMDRHSGFSTNDVSMLGEEEDLSRASDLVVTTARVLYEEQSQLNPSCALVPNACQFEHFCTPFGAPPAALANLPHPVIGYYGAISDWFDTALLAQVARTRPGWSFVLIGATTGADLAPLAGLGNVHLLGEQPYRALPPYLHAFDCCLIPFKINPLTEATNPVKYYEYLSAGKPVVSVSLPELLPYAHDGLAYLADTPEATVQAVEQALREDGPDLAERRRQLAQANTWEERFARLDAAVRGLHRKASIIVLTYNNLTANRLCLESILRNTLWPDFELFVVDNASTDGTPEYLRRMEKLYPNVRVILNAENRGFAGGNNQALQAASGDYVVLLNNDTMVTRGWLGRLIRHLEQDPTVGLVGPVTNSIGNEAIIEVCYASLAEMEAFAEARAREYAGRSFEIQVPALFCAAARRSLYQEVGLLDERYEVGLFEDDDLALRVRRAGYKNLCAQDVFIHHFLGESFRLFTSEKHRQIFEANRRRFEEKWQIRWVPHRDRPRAA